MSIDISFGVPSDTTLSVWNRKVAGSDSRVVSPYMTCEYGRVSSSIFSLYLFQKPPHVLNMPSIRGAETFSVERQRQCSSDST